MHRNEDLHRFLLDKAHQLTEDWYASLDKSDPIGVYSTTCPDAIKKLKEQNFEFHLHLCNVFLKEEFEFFLEFEKWVFKVASDKEHLITPTHLTIREFIRVRKQYLDFIKEFVSLQKREISKQQIDAWNEMTIKAFDSAILRFTEEKSNYQDSQIQSQKEMINELSSPVIDLNNNTALLPLVGEIDTARAKLILENTLQQCSHKRVEHLFIDLSGVVVVDTMVAHQIFQIIDTLNLIGVTCTISGIRPEIAQTAVQLGLAFDKFTTTSTLSQAIFVKAKQVN